MALLQVNFHAKALRRVVTFNALVPIDTLEIPGDWDFWNEYIEKAII